MEERTRDVPPHRGIHLGVATIFARQICKNVIAGDFFGEAALVGACDTRTATVIARTDVQVLSIGRPEFLSLVRGSDSIIQKVLHLAEMRRDTSWEVIQSNSVLQRLSQAQKTALQGLMTKHSARVGEEIISAGTMDEKFRTVLVSTGVFDIKILDRRSTTPPPISRSINDACLESNPAAASGGGGGGGGGGGKDGATLSVLPPSSAPLPTVLPRLRGGNAPRLATRGALVGDISATLANTMACVGVTCAVAGEYYSFQSDALKSFLDNNPGIRLSLLDCHVVPPHGTDREMGGMGGCGPEYWADI